MLHFLRQKIPIKQFMIGYLVLLLAASSFYIGEFSYFWKGLLVASFYVLCDLVWTRVRDKTWYLPLSSTISGLIIGLISVPNPGWSLVLGLPLAAVASKQLIKWGRAETRRQKHIFNPAAFSLVLLALFGYPAASWWAVSLGRPFFYIILIAGFFILWRLNRWDMAAGFLIPYAAVFKSLAFDGTVIFFTTVMLIEPITSNASGASSKSAYGAAVSFCAIVISFIGGSVPLPFDPLLFALLMGNLLLSLKTI